MINYWDYQRFGLPNRHIRGQLYVVGFIAFVLLALHMLSLTSRQSEYSALRATKWIVVTSINEPTDQILKLSAIPDWQLLVVADKETPSSWNVPNAIFLDVEAQKRLDYHIMRYIPWNSYTRKMIGYLFAIQHGARFIYDTDDDNAPNDPKTFQEFFDFNETTRGLVQQKNKDAVTNPYVHFGQESIWPRGFPLDRIGQSYNNFYRVCDMDTPLIQQGLVNGDPDVDAIFRLTRNKLHSKLNVKFDSVAPPIILPKSLMAPFNSQNTLFHYDAFWALILPVSVTTRVADIWRAYWSQPLLWLVGGRLGFYPPHTVQIRSPHIYLKDFAYEDKLYKQSGELVDLIQPFKCTSKELYPCMVELTNRMVEHGMWGQVEVKLIKAWIRDLRQLGYKAPNIPIAAGMHEPCLENKFPSSTIATFAGNSNPVGSHDTDRIALRKICNFTVTVAPSPSTSKSEVMKTSYSSTLLVIMLKSLHLGTIKLLDAVYRPRFPNLLYCADALNMPAVSQILKWNVNASTTKFSLVQADVANGKFTYECGIRAIQMNYGVGGYLVISDEILLNFWNTHDLNEAWRLGAEIVDLNVRDAEVIKPALQKIYLNREGNPNYREFVSNRENYNSTIALRQDSSGDVFYFPAAKQEIFYEVASVMREFKVTSRTAIPTLMSGLSTRKHIVTLKGANVLHKDRFNAFDYFKASNDLVQPVKYRLVLERPTLSLGFCSKYVSMILSLDV